MHDVDVRKALRKRVLREFRRDAGTIILEELGVLNGECRIDLAVINGELHGYEIKSNADTLDRLPTQATAYNRVFDKIHLVVGERHWNHSLSIIAPYWGVVVAKHSKGKTTLELDREATENPEICATSLAALLWRSELITLLENSGLKGVRSKRLSCLHSLLASTLALEDLRAAVRGALKTREQWRPDALRSPRKIEI